jgi:ABC-type methionine transport system permease subunit
MIYRVNINREILWIVVAVAIAVATVMIVARSIGWTACGVVITRTTSQHLCHAASTETISNRSRALERLR